MMSQNAVIAVLDERIDEFGELIKEHYALDDLGDPSATSEVCRGCCSPDITAKAHTWLQEDIVVVGRICGEADASVSTSSKLVEGSIFLESSRMMGSGSRVPLRFSPQLKLRKTIQGAGGLGVFAGAIVALKGKNGGGGSFVAEEILGVSRFAARVLDNNNNLF